MSKSVYISIRYVINLINIIIKFMKALLLGIFSMLIFNFSLAQEAKRIDFTYDNSGNQKLRTICMCTARQAPDSIYKNSETLRETDLIADEVNEQISYYPNPVREELYIKWVNEEKAYVNTIEIYSMSGQLQRSIPNLKNKEMEVIAFQGYAEGLYNLILLYNNGEKKILKIVKK